MKKLAIGCAVVVLLVCVAAAGFTYYVYRQVRSSVAQLAAFGNVEEVERGIRVRDPFTAPASEEITREQLDRFMRVQGIVRQRLGEHFADFERKYKQLSGTENTGLLDLPALVKAYGDVASGWMSAKRGQVEGLNEVGMSLEEYRWIRDQAYRALGIPFVDLDVTRILESARAGIAVDTAGQLRGAIGPAGPEANRKLIEAVRKQLEENVALASFGL